MTHRFPISCCSIALRNLPIREACDKIADAGFDGVEIFYHQIQEHDDATLHELARHCAARKLQVTAVAPYFSFTRGRDAWLDSLKTGEAVLHAAGILGSKKVRTFIDVGPDGLPSNRADETHWKAARDGLRELCDLDPAVEFVIETHENTLADTLPTVRRVFEEVQRPNLRLNYQGTEDFLERGYYDCLDALYPLVSHMHWQQVLPDGGHAYVEESGIIDFERLIHFLLSKGYAGTASVEYCWSPVDENRLPAAWKFLSGILAKEPAGRV